MDIDILHGSHILVILIYQQVQCWCSRILHDCWSGVSLRYNMIVFLKLLSSYDFVGDKPRTLCEPKRVD